jgi:peroxin-13
MAAMVSVAEQFGNLRDTLGSIFGIYALLRYVRVAMAKLRGQPIPPEETPDLTTDSFNQFDSNSPPPPPSLSKKPLVIFILAVFGLPYLMGKLIRAMARSAPQRITSRALDLGSAQFYRAVFDFTPRNRAEELALRKGDIVAVVVQGQGGWWRVRARDGREGYVPSNYLERVYNPAQQVGAVRPAPIMSPPGEKGHAFIEEFKDEE